MAKQAVRKVFFLLAAFLYIVAAVMLYKGYDKMTNYYNSEYSISRNVNAYVGGDAYNYIINGNYSTGFFVLSMGCVIAGTIFLTGGLITGVLPDPVDQQKTILSLSKDPNNTENTLPDL